MERKTGLSPWYFQILIKGLATDTEFARKRGFRLTGASSAAQLDNLIVQQRFLATSVGAALLGQCDSFALSLAYQGVVFRRRLH